MKTLKTTIILSIFAGLVAISGCQKEEIDPIAEPIACFEMTSGYTGDIVNVKNCSEYATSYMWDFGDGSSSTLESPNHSFAVAGTYKVKLNVFNESGNDYKSQYVEIIAKEPVGMIINSINLKEWPQSNNGSAWDNSDYPDIYPVIYSNTVEYLTSYNYHLDCTSSNSYLFDSDFGFPVTISANDISSYLSVVFYDYDTITSSDFMGGVSFIPNINYIIGVSVITVSTSEWEFDLNVTWLY